MSSVKYSQSRGRIISNIEVAPSHFSMELETQFDLKDVAPGHFVMLKVSDVGLPLLRRPFGIYRIDLNKETFHILYRVVGDGTRLLSEISAGVEIDVLGPLGNGFDISLAGESPMLVGGGVGIPPLYLLASFLAEEGINPKVIVGGRTKNELLSIKEFKEIGAEVFTATDDGSEGHHGFVTGVLEESLGNSGQPTSIYACGPEPMLKSVGEIAMRANIKCQLSLEAMMACGFGVCLGCIVKTSTNKNGEAGEYSRVCCEGPVFNAEDIIWE